MLGSLAPVEVSIPKESHLPYSKNRFQDLTKTTSYASKGSGLLSFLVSKVKGWAQSFWNDLKYKDWGEFFCGSTDEYAHETDEGYESLRPRFGLQPSWECRSNNY